MSTFSATPLFVSIVSRCTFNGRPLALAANLDDLNGNLWVVPLDPSQPSQRWMPAAYTPPGSGGVLGVVLINMLTGQAAYATGGNGDPVSQVAVNAIDAHSVWTLGGDEGGGYMAVRPLLTDSQNLNVPGNSPYSPRGVCTWVWGSHGSGNSHWTFIATDARHPDGFDNVSYGPLMRGLYARCGWAASDNPANPGGQIVSEAWDGTRPAQLFFPAWYFTGGMPGGVVLINAQSQRALYATGINGDPVTQVDQAHIDSHSVWVPFTVSSGSVYFPLMPQIQKYQNLNIAGYPPYGPDRGIITWSWGGGQDNEYWTFNNPYAQATP